MTGLTDQSPSLQKLHNLFLETTLTAKHPLCIVLLLDALRSHSDTVCHASCISIYVADRSDLTKCYPAALQSVCQAKTQGEAGDGKTATACLAIRQAHFRFNSHMISELSVCNS